jgi:hypothetical protein
MVEKIKTLVKALQPFSHGNVDAKKDGVYAMNPADAEELRKAGFVSLETSGEPEQSQVDLPRAPKQPGDVVVDDADDLLGDGAKMDGAPGNKMAKAASNKAVAKK